MVNSKLNKILEKTTKLSFPRFANSEKKKVYLEQIHQQINDEIAECLVDEIDVFAINRDVLWDKSCKEATKEFDTLPQGLKMNSFYLQEVMHRYVESVIKLING